MTTPYAAIPVGPGGLEHDRTQVVFGKALTDALTRQELARRVALLTLENERLRRLNSGLELERLAERLDNECELRVKAQRRLHKVALAFGAIVRAHPETAELIDRARDEIWDLT